MRFITMFVAIVGTFFLTADRAAAQHLWWDAKESADATCVYGEITVLASHHPIY